MSELPIRADDPTDERADERAESRFLWPPLFLSILLLWVVPMGTSLGLDESGNWWVIKDGLSKMIERSRIWTGGESVLFNLLVMAARALGGDSDVAMRIPSLAMMLVTLFFMSSDIYRAWLEGRGAIWGFRLRSSVTHGSMLVSVFERGAE